MRVYAVGIVPPPVTGMTLVTEKIVQQLQSTGPLTFWNWSPGHQPTRARFHTMRVLHTLGCVLRMLANGRVAGNRLYLLANSRSGLLLTVVLATLARLLGYRLYLHHHTYGYIDRHNAAMAWVVRQMRSNGVHIVHCPRMVDDFRRQYSAARRFLTMYPSVVSLECGQPRSAPREPFCLGVLSNLTLDKGVGLAIETLAR